MSGRWDHPCFSCTHYITTECEGGHDECPPFEEFHY